MPSDGSVFNAAYTLFRTGRSSGAPGGKGATMHGHASEGITMAKVRARFLQPLLLLLLLFFLLLLSSRPRRLRPPLRAPFPLFLSRCVLPSSAAFSERLNIVVSEDDARALFAELDAENGPCWCASSRALMPSGRG